MTFLHSENEDLIEHGFKDFDTSPYSNIIVQ